MAVYDALDTDIDVQPRSPSPAPARDPDHCSSCEIVLEYTTLANEFTQDLSLGLLGGMEVLFLSIVSIWIIFHGYKFLVGAFNIMGFAKDLFFVFLSWFFLTGQGPELVNTVFDASLAVMGSAAALALEVGQNPEVIKSSRYTGMSKLVLMAERGVSGVFGMATEIAASAKMTNPMPILYAVFLVIPYFLLLVVYFAQVVVSIFRVMMLATLSPFLMLAVGFGWGRGMVAAALKALLAAFMVLFGATAALAVMLYGVNALDIGGPDIEMTRTVSLSNPKFLLTLALGWLGTAFMTEATGMANSIAGSSLTNTAAGVITAGATATAGATLWPAVRQARQAVSGGGRAVAASAMGYNDGLPAPSVNRMVERFLTGDGTRPRAS